MGPSGVTTRTEHQAGDVQQGQGAEQQAGTVMGHQVLGESRHLEVMAGDVQQEEGAEQQAGVVLGHQVLGESRHLEVVTGWLAALGASSETALGASSGIGLGLVVVLHSGQ